MEEKVNQQTNAEYEIWVNEALILRGDDIDELLMYAKLMYLDNPLVIKSSPADHIKNNQ